MAREAALAPSQFIRALKAVFGQTPHQVRIDARLELAKRLLITDSIPVTDVCAAVGFVSLGTFSHVFTRRIGSSPSAFRREARALVQVPGMLPLKLYPGCFTLMAHWPENAIVEKRAAAGSARLHLPAKISVVPADGIVSIGLVEFSLRQGVTRPGDY